MENFGSLMIKYIESKQLTQQEFATSLGWHKSQVSNYKSGKFKPNFDTLKRIKEVYPDFPIGDIKVEGHAPSVRVEPIDISYKDKYIEAMEKLTQAKEKLEVALMEISDWKEESHLKQAQIWDLKKKIKDLETELVSISNVKND